MNNKPSRLANVFDEFGDCLIDIVAMHYTTCIDRPETDPTDPTTGWGTWVAHKTNAFIAAIEREIAQ